MLPTSGAAWPDTIICPGDTVHLHASGGTAYQWTPSLLTEPPDITYVEPLVTTTYTVFITTTCGVDTQTVTITVAPPPTATASGDTSIYLGGQAQLYGAGSGFYQWHPAGTLSCNDCPSPQAFPQVTTTYYLTVTDAIGCSAHDSVVVIVLLCSDVHVPNAFTPNDDNHNDHFSLLYPGSFIMSSLEVYNRWGQLVFQTNDPTTGWDGTWRNRDAPTGTYAWIVRGTCNDEQLIRSGNVTLLR
jgi:gliding motility-associated-like protein